MSSNSTDDSEVPHYAYLVLRIFLTFPTKIGVLCHHAETNDVFMHGGRVEPIPFTKTKRVEIFYLETLILHIRFK